MVNEKGSPSRAAAWAAMALFGLVSTGIIAATIEYNHYHALLLMAYGNLYLPAWVPELIFGFLWAKSLLVLAPLLALAGLMMFLGRPRGAWAVFGIGALVVCFWLAVDVKIHAMTHNHVLSYVAFLRNPNAFDMGGGFAALVGPFVGVFLLTALGVVGLGLAMILLAGWLVRIAGSGGPRLCPILAAVLFLIPILAVFPGRRLCRKPAVLAYLYTELPVSIPLISEANGGPSPADRSRLRLSALVQQTYERLFARLCKAAPLDKKVRLDLPSPPNVILLVLESLRADALSPKMMPRLNAWADKGLRFERHYSAADNSQEGLFSLLYGRTPLAYDSTLAAGLAPQLCTTLQNSGYRTACVVTHPPSWAGNMEKYLNTTCFNEVAVKNEGALWRRDMEAFSHLGRLLREHTGRPQFILLYTTATHFPYEYPPEYELYRPVASPQMAFAHADPRHRPEILNRYMNSARFTDDKVADLIEGLDPKRNLIVVTGDHGESLFEDGYFMHCGRLSDVQTRVPMAIVGPGVPPGTVTRLAAHVDFLPTLLHLLAGKPVPVAHCQGRDLRGPAQTADRVMLCTVQRYSGPWMQGVLVEPEGRVLFKAMTDKPCFIILGRCDEAANVDIMNPMPEKELRHWQQSFEAELTQLAQ